MMHGRKKHLLDSYKASSSELTGVPAHHVAAPAADMALNLNQSLTEQLTQHRRSHVDGCAPGSRRTPGRLSPHPDVVAGSATTAAAQQLSSARAEVDPEARCGRTTSPARGPRRSRDPPPVDEPPLKPGSARPPRSPAADPGSLGQAAFPPGIDPLTARLALQHQLGLFPHPALHPPPPSFILPPDSGVTQHLELLYRIKYPGYPVPPPWLLYQYQDELVRDATLIQQQQQQATSERLEHGLRERERVDDERNTLKDRQERSVLYTAYLGSLYCLSV